ncbi:MAG TPA: nuclear transport factor 2 family protein [Opitutaceae bacterium]|jgi:hypothetical protein
MSEAEALVRRQLEAYNARDVDALLACYAPDARMYRHPSELVVQGRDAMGRLFRDRFAEPNLHAQVVQRIVLANKVIDHELVTRTFPEGPGTLEVAMIYEIRDGLIANAWSIPGTITLASRSPSSESGR